MSGRSVLMTVMFALLGADCMDSQNIGHMKVVLDSRGVYGAAPPLILGIDANNACAVNLTHDLQQDMTQRVFTGIGRKCLQASSDMRQNFKVLGSLLAKAKEKSPSPGRGVHFLRYSIGSGSELQSGVLSLEPRTEATRAASSAFHSLHHEISVNGEVDAGIWPELDVREDRIVRLTIKNIGREAVAIDSPFSWVDSDDPMVPNVTAAIWAGTDGVVAVLGQGNWRADAKDEDPIEIPVGGFASFEFDLSKEVAEEIKGFSGEVQVAGDLRFHVKFESGLGGMATASIDSKRINMSR